MAKFGEGDERWIVQDRADGANVNNWHWVERDVLWWAKQRLQELLGDRTLWEGPDGAVLRTASVSVEGEAIVNNRKNKLIPSYELKITGRWNGNAGGVEAEGSFEIPYLAEENYDEDPELLVHVTGGGEEAQKLRQAFLSQGRKVFNEQLRVFVKEIQAGGPSAAESREAGAAGTKKGANIQAALVEPIRQAPKQAHVPLAQESPVATIRLTEEFYCRPDDIFDCFVDPARLQAVTQGPAEVEPRVGGKFVILRGAVKATFTAFERGKHMALDWRFSSFPDDAVSKVDMTFEETKPGTTVVKLVQKNVPKVDRFGNEGLVELQTNGWKTQIFGRIRQIFGYGA